MNLVKISVMTSTCSRPSDAGFKTVKSIANTVATKLPHSYGEAVSSRGSSFTRGSSSTWGEPFHYILLHLLMYNLFFCNMI